MIEETPQEMRVPASAPAGAATDTGPTRVEPAPLERSVEQDDFGPAADFEVTAVKQGTASAETKSVATEIPFTIVANDTELATLLCSPSDLREFAYGFLFTSGFIKRDTDVRSCVIDTTRWVAHMDMVRPPDAAIISRRLYTSGCGKGVMYATLSEITARRRIQAQLTLTFAQVGDAAHWLQHASPLYRKTGGTHTAGLLAAGDTPGIRMDDIGRHNAVDKVVGRALLENLDFSRHALITSGRVSSEILHKTVRAGIPIIISRGAPTHQTVLRARETGVTVVAFARGGRFMIFAGRERIVCA